MTEIFIFGSNTEGRHGAGAALHATKHYGAIYGVPMGRQGDSYAIVTKELRVKQGYRPVFLGEIAAQISVLRWYAQCAAPEHTFLLTKLGCGLAGFDEEDMRKICQDWLSALDNVQMPAGW